MASKRPFSSMSSAMSIPDWLPILERRADIMRVCRENPIVIVKGECGSGKSLMIPDFLWQCCGGKIACTQPRIAAAQALARAKATQWNTRVPGYVGFHGGSTKLISEHSVLIYITTGTMVLQSEQHLLEYSGMVLDECHEQDEDFEIMLLRVQNLIQQRADFRVVFSSADTAYIQKLFPDAPFICVPGRLHPIRDWTWLKPSTTTMRVYVKDAILKALKFEKWFRGMLVFVPEVAWIYSLKGELEQLDKFLCVCAFHSHSDDDEIAACYQPVYARTRKVILATDAAETSITFADVDVVIDLGLNKRKVLNIHNGRPQYHLSELVVSSTSSLQRRGRAGRVAPGLCIRLYEDVSAETPPISDVWLCPTHDTVLKAMSANVWVRLRDTMQPHHCAVLTQKLKDVGCIDGREFLNPLGFDVLHIPLETLQDKIALNAARYTSSYLVVATALAYIQNFRKLFKFTKDEQVLDRRRLLQHHCGDFHTACQIAAQVREEDFALKHGLNAKMLEISRQLLSRLDVAEHPELLTPRDELALSKHVRSHFERASQTRSKDLYVLHTGGRNPNDWNDVAYLLGPGHRQWKAVCYREVCDQKVIVDETSGMTSFRLSGVCRIQDEPDLARCLVPTAGGLGSCHTSVSGASSALPLSLACESSVPIEPLFPLIIPYDIVPLVATDASSAVMAVENTHNVHERKALHDAARSACADLCPIEQLSQCKKYGLHKVSSKNRKDLPEYIFFAAVSAGCLRCVRHELEVKLHVDPDAVSMSHNYTARDFANYSVLEKIDGALEVQKYLNEFWPHMSVLSSR